MSLAEEYGQAVHSRYRITGLTEDELHVIYMGLGYVMQNSGNRELLPGHDTEWAKAQNMRTTISMVLQRARMERMNVEEE